MIGGRRETYSVWAEGDAQAFTTTGLNLLEDLVIEGNIKELAGFGWCDISSIGWWRRRIREYADTLRRNVHGEGVLK
jgi:hypothetical protein